jgi:hypothetical protein
MVDLWEDVGSHRKNNSVDHDKERETHFPPRDSGSRNNAV